MTSYLLSNDVRSVDAGGLDELEEIDDVFRVDSVQHSMDTDERSSSSHTITTEREGEGVRGTMVETERDILAEDSDGFVLSVPLQFVEV